MNSQDRDDLSKLTFPLRSATVCSRLDDVTLAATLASKPAATMASLLVAETEHGDTSSNGGIAGWNFGDSIRDCRRLGEHERFPGEVSL